MARNGSLAGRNARELLRIATLRVAPAVNPDGIDLVTGAAENAGYKDWFIQDFRRPGFTIEAGSGENPLPLSQLDEIWRDNVGILTEGMIAAAR